MEQFLFNETFRLEHYGCQTFSEEKYPASERGSVFLGVLYILLFTFYDVLYIPVLVIMYSTDMFKNSCFKIMFYLGIVDVTSVAINCGLTGYLCIIGAVYCTHPFTIFISGSIVTALWCTACMGCAILAFNRCLEITSHEWAEWLFGGAKTYLWLCLPTTYFWLVLIFTTPTIFSGFYCGYFSDPYIGMHEEPDQWYNDLQHTINNCASLTTLCCLYMYLCIILYRKTRRENGAGNRNFMKIQVPTQLQILIQAVAICVLNTLAAGIYCYIQFFSVPLVIITIAQLTWQGSQGAAPIIFLIFNKTIRRDCFRMVGLDRLVATLSTVSVVDISPKAKPGATSGSGPRSPVGAGGPSFVL
uniref:G protein-coupled receptor n=1 Tax=Steinernema glaseri TaxID=37863 RepID=A0A1I7Z3V6_9BILA